MFNQIFEHNGVNRTGTECEGSSSSKCSPAQQRGLGRHPATARMKWDKEVNKVVMECFYRSRPFNEEGKPIRGYRQRMFREWKDRGMFETTEQRLYDQARAIRKNGWLSELELEMIRRKIENEAQLVVDGIVAEVNVTDDGIMGGVNMDLRLDEIGGEGDGIMNEPIDVVDVGEHYDDISQENGNMVAELKQIILEGRTSDGIIFKKVNKRSLRAQTERVNSVMNFVKMKNITETNKLLNAASVWVADQMGLKRFEINRKKEPWWKWRIEHDIKSLKHDIHLLHRESKGELGNKTQWKLKHLEEKYRVRRKGINTVIEELKQKILAMSAKEKRYEQRITQFRQNRIFNVDQKKIYTEFNGSALRSTDVPNAEESRKFWGEIWSIEKKHSKTANWLKQLKEEMSNEHHAQEGLVISVDKIKKQCRRMPTWKAPGRDKVQGFWIKSMTNLHERIAEQLNKILIGENELPAWMTYGHTLLCQKDVPKGNAVENYWPITCLPLMWKLLTGVIAEDMYTYLEKENLLPNEQTGCKHNSRGMKNQLLIDETVLKDCRKRNTNRAMAWIDYKKAYDLVPHSWIKECLELMGIAENVRELLEKSMKQWKLSLTSNGNELGDVSQ